MTTSHRLVLKAVVSTLIAAGVAAGRVYSSRTRAINSETPHAVIVRLGRSASMLAHVKGGPTTWKTLVQIESYGRMTGGEPDEASDEIVEQVFAALAENPSLGGKAIEVAPLDGDTLSWDLDELDTALGCTTAKFIVEHRTKGRTLEHV
ncbi:hypothetical protein GTP45_01125 [Pseudoduganella sp. FT55W]|uniref:Uncharacterized protein n=1 Tax=Duganella rivi TaxID=2666083 RepID=A0A7X4GLV7_9BURK|nr:hypothetical protein [Duganella rivi]MYM65434.1 hypothetical protein [Duganella rivi]